MTEMPAEVRDFVDEIDDVIYWDSSFAIAHFFEQLPSHTECSNFVTRLMREGVLCVSSDLVHNEVAFFIQRSYLSEHGARVGMHWREVHRRMPNALSAINALLRRVRNELEAMTFHLPMPANVRDDAYELMERYHLLPTDAFHVAIALHHDVNAFASLDEDFARVDGIVVYAPKGF